MTDDTNKRRPRIARAAFRVLLVSLGFGLWYLFGYAGSPLTTAWNPLDPLNVRDQKTPVTAWKLRRALADDQLCLAALATAATAQHLPDFEESDLCHIRPQVRLSRVGAASLQPLNTRCQTALRTAMWEHHGIQPAAQANLGQGVQRIEHFSSYNCRAMRTTNGGSPRMSTHATADAIDVRGFTLEDGTRLTLLDHWNGTPQQRDFLRAVRDSACTWFRVTLGPDYNRLHADHFHLQHTGWGLCR